MPSIHIARERSLYEGRLRRQVPFQQRKVARLREQLSTGRRINRPSDDPSGFAQARRLETLGRRYDQHRGSIEDSRGWVIATEDALDHMANLVASAKEVGTEAANGTHDAADREALASRIDGIREEMIEQLNAKYDGEYLFGGTHTLTKPFKADGTLADPFASTPPDPSDDPYDNVEGARRRRIGPERELTININGKQVHQVASGPDGFTTPQALEELATVIRNTGSTVATAGTGGDLDADSDVDADDMEAALSRVETTREHLSGLGADAGNTARRLADADAQLQAAARQVESRRSQIEDTSYAKTVTELREAQTTLDAALRVTAQTLQTTLLDYLR